jgi:hypothetical protein
MALKDGGFVESLDPIPVKCLGLTEPLPVAVTAGESSEPHLHLPRIHLICAADQGPDSGLSAVLVRWSALPPAEGSRSMG